MATWISDFTAGNKFSQISGRANSCLNISGTYLKRAARFLQLHEQQLFSYSLENVVSSNSSIHCLILGRRCMVSLSRVIKFTPRDPRLCIISCSCKAQSVINFFLSQNLFLLEFNFTGSYFLQIIGKFATLLDPTKISCHRLIILLNKLIKWLQYWLQGILQSCLQQG